MHRQDWLKLSTEELLKFIEHDHRRIIEKLLKLQTLLEQPTKHRSDAQDSMLASLREFLPSLKAGLEKHFASEEQLLFPYIRKMDKFDSGLGAKPEFHRSSIKNPISLLESEHDVTENVIFKEIHTITEHSPISDDEAFSTLCNGLKDIQNILSEHIHVENTVLFPLAIELELRLMHKK
ncbi:MAG: hemerythrin domain-containing protein [Phycisphaerae bacterium]|jgi:regulator of cell morphogenesis and NO signaling